MSDRQRIFRHPQPGDHLTFADGSTVTIVAAHADRIEVLACPAPERCEWPRSEFELAVLGAIDVQAAVIDDENA